MFGDMKGKLEAMQAKMLESKARLDNITVDGEAEGGLVKVSMTGNRSVKSVSIDPSMKDDLERIEDLTIIAFNRALEKAESVNEAEMQGAAKGFIPGF